MVRKESIIHISQRTITYLNLNNPNLYFQYRYLKYLKALYAANLQQHIRCHYFAVLVANELFERYSKNYFYFTAILIYIDVNQIEIL